MRFFFKKKGLVVRGCFRGERGYFLGGNPAEALRHWFDFSVEDRKEITHNLCELYPHMKSRSLLSAGRRTSRTVEEKNVLPYEILRETPFLEEFEFFCFFRPEVKLGTRKYLDGALESCRRVQQALPRWHIPQSFFGIPFVSITQGARLV